MSVSSVVVAGAGPVGLAVAAGLRHHGLDPLVLEAKPHPDPHSRAPGVLPRTLEVLRSWGLDGAFLAEGTFLREPALWRPGAAEPLVRVDLGALADVTAYPGILILPQDRTEALLAAHLDDRGVEVRRGHRVVGFDASADGVRVRVEPPDGPPYTVDAGWLVGCDGAHSRVREVLGWPLVGHTYRTRLLLADVRLEGAPDLPFPLIAEGPGVVAGLRLQGPLWRVIAVLGPDEDPEAASAPEAVEARARRLFGDRAHEVVWVSTFRIHCRTSPRFRAGRVLLAGDAAHINSPAGGQGMNAGIQDAHNLAWKLARGGEALVASYEPERRGAVVRDVDRYTDLLTRLGLAAPAWVQALSGPLLRAILANPATRRRLLLRAAMLDTRYRSPLVGGGRLAGARAPDGDLLAPEGGGVVRVHDLCKRVPVLLGFEVDVPPVSGVATARISRRPAPGAWQDAGAWAAWRAAPGTVALVRPDGHVGFTAYAPSADVVYARVAQALGDVEGDRRAAEVWEPAE